MQFHSEHLKSIREAKRLTQQNLANTLGVTRQAVIHWEKGDNNPPLETIGKLSSFFDVAYTFFIKE